MKQEVTKAMAHRRGAVFDPEALDGQDSFSLVHCLESFDALFYAPPI